MVSSIARKRWIIISSLTCLVVFLLCPSPRSGAGEGSSSGGLARRRRNIGGPCNLDAAGDDPKAVVQTYRTCRDELISIIEKGIPIPSAFEKTREGRTMVERTLRLVNARKKCATRKVASMPMIESWIRVSKPHELAYCQLEKTGSSTMLTFLCEINNMETMYPRNDDLHHTSLDHFKVVGEEAVQLASRYLDVVQVRHPFTRLVSCYCEKVLNEKPAFIKRFEAFRSHRNQSATDLVRDQLPHYRFMSDAKKGTKKDQFHFQFYLKVLEAPGKQEFMTRPYRHEGRDPNHVPSFREFALEAAYQILRCGTNPQCRKEVNASFGRQIDKCDPCAWNFDILMKLETIDDDFPLLRKLIGVYKEEEEEDKADQAEAAPVVNRKISACKSYDHYMHQLRSDDLDLLYTAYYEDFELFDYTPFEV